MVTPNRAALLNKTHKVLKNLYKPVVPIDNRPLLEHMLFACCLENAPYEAAEKVYTHLAGTFFDWNEVRVSTVTELAESMRPLPDPASAAANLKRVLQGVFESTYSFDLEHLKKQNIGQGIKKLEKVSGASSFVVAYATQIALGGHSIPLDSGALQIFTILGIASDAEAKSGQVAGLERTIPKNKGVEFGSLLHQLAADFVANPFSPQLRKLLLGINPDSQGRFPKRGVKKPEPPPVVVKKAAEKHPGEKPPVGKLPPGKHASEKHTGEKQAPDKHGAEKHVAGKAPDKHAADKHNASKQNADKHAPASSKHPPAAAASSAKKKLPPEKKKARPTGKPASSGKSQPAATKRKSSNKQLTKRKPR